MKKFLSLVLALVMAMSLVTVSAGAKDFTDSSSITYSKAVEVISAAGIVDGYTDGSFNPAGNLTRGAAAKIICNLILGPTTAAALSADTAPYSDVPTTNEFSGYIAYCQTAGIISGYADGTFRPAATLTGYAFMKMLLGALDYDSDIEGYTGANWSVNVAKQAIGIELDDGYVGDFVGTRALTREEACLFAFNTLTANMVNYPDNSTITVGDITITNHSKAEDVANNASSETIYDDNILQFAEKYFTNLKLTETTDDFGRPADKWSYKGTEIGTYAVDADYSYTAGASGDTNADKVKSMGLKDFDVDTTYYTVNGLKTSFNSTSSDGKLEEIAGLTSDGVLVEVFTDDVDADTINYVSVIKTQLMQVSSIQSSKVTLKKNAEDIQNKTDTVNFMNVNAVEDDEDGYDVLKDLKADDYVLIVPVWDSGSTYNVASAAVPETVTGVITSYATKSGNEKVKSITIADSTYKMSNMWTSEDGKLNVDTVLSTTQESTVYLDTYGYAIYVTDVVDSNSAIIIDEIYSSVVNGKIVKYATGWNTSGEEISLNLGTTVTYPKGYDETSVQGATFEYESTTSNNADYRLVGQATTYAKGTLVYAANTADAVSKGSANNRYVKASASSATVGGQSVQYASDVNFIFITKDTDGDVTGISVTEGVTEVGDSANTAKQYNLVYVLNDDGDEIVAVVVPNDDDAGNTENLMYVQKTTGYTTQDGKRVAQFTAYIDGEKYENCISTKETVDGDSFYTYSYNESTHVYTLSKYTKDTGKNTSVKSGDNVDGAELTGKTDYTFLSEATVDETPYATLNAKSAVVIDLDTDDGYTFTTVKEMKDAIINKTIDKKTGNAITGFKVSYIFNGSDNTGSGKVAYLFITDTKSSDEVVTVDADIEVVTADDGTILVYDNEGDNDISAKADAIEAYLNELGYTDVSMTLTSTAIKDITGVKNGRTISFDEADLSPVKVTVGGTEKIVKASATVADVTGATGSHVYDATTEDYVEKTENVADGAAYSGDYVVVNEATTNAESETLGLTVTVDTDVAYLSVTGGDVTYTVKISGTASNSGTAVKLTASAGELMETIPVKTGVERTSDTVLTIADTTEVGTDYTVTCTLTVAAGTSAVAATTFNVVTAAG